MTDSPPEVVELALAYCHRRYAFDESFLAVLDTGRQLSFPDGEAPALQVLGSPADLLGWLTGRGDPTALSTVGGPLPVLPAWS